MSQMRKRIQGVTQAQSGWVAVFATTGGHSRIELVAGWGLASWVDATEVVNGAEHLVPMCVNQHTGAAFDALRDPHYLGVEKEHERGSHTVDPALEAGRGVDQEPSAPDPAVRLPQCEPGDLRRGEGTRGRRRCAVPLRVSPSADTAPANDVKATPRLKCVEIGGEIDRAGAGDGG